MCDDIGWCKGEWHQPVELGLHLEIYVHITGTTYRMELKHKYGLHHLTTPEDS